MYDSCLNCQTVQRWELHLRRVIKDHPEVEALPQAASRMHAMHKHYLPCMHSQAWKDILAGHQAQELVIFSKPDRVCPYCLNAGENEKHICLDPEPDYGYEQGVN